MKAARIRLAVAATLAAVACGMGFVWSTLYVVEAAAIREWVTHLEDEELHVLIEAGSVPTRIRHHCNSSRKLAREGKTEQSRVHRSCAAQAAQSHLLRAIMVTLMLSFSAVVLAVTATCLYLLPVPKPKPIPRPRRPPVKDPVALGKLIQETRLGLELSQTQLAKIGKTNQGRISNIEAGTSSPTEALLAWLDQVAPGEPGAR